MKWFGFLRKLSLWVVLLPFVIWLTGAAMNQLVLVRNGGRFPVMYNQAHQYEHLMKLKRKAIDSKSSQDDVTDAEIRIEEFDHDFIDDTHVIMNPTKTHWNWLGDWIDLGTGGINSPGDILLDASVPCMFPFLFIWVGVIVERFRKE